MTNRRPTSVDSILACRDIVQLVLWLVLKQVNKKSK